MSRTFMALNLGLALFTLVGGAYAVVLAGRGNRSPRYAVTLAVLGFVFAFYWLLRLAGA